MTVESVTYLNHLDPLLPAGTDDRSEGDNHIRNIKAGLKNTFPNVAGPVTSTQAHLNNPILATTPAADTIPYYTGSGSASTTGLTAYGRTLLATTSASALGSSLNLSGSYVALNNPNTIQGHLALTGVLYVGSGQNNSVITMVDTDHGNRHIHNNDSSIGFLGNDGGWKLRVWDNGTVWTAQLGDLASWVQGRCDNAQNGANAYTNQFVNSLRWVDAGYDEWNTAGNNMVSPSNPYGVIKEIGMAFGATTYAAGGAIYTMLQAHTPNSGWFNV